MKKRYIVCVNNSTEEQEQKFLEYIKEQGFGWWHYLKNTWLIIDVLDKSDVSGIRDNVMKAFEGEYTMVFQLNEKEGTWSGFGPKSDERDMFKWIKEKWK